MPKTRTIVVSGKSRRANKASGKKGHSPPRREGTKILDNRIRDFVPWW
jgi:hypothetical protein